MQKLLTVEDVAEVLQVSARSAYRKMHEMPHTKAPLRVAETALREWITAQTVIPSGTKKTPMRRVKMTEFHIERRRE